MRPLTELPAVVNVAVSSTAFINLPLGPVYDALLFRYVENGSDATAAEFAAAMTEIRVKVDGEALQTYRGSELGDLNAFYGRTHVNGVMPLFFAPPWARSLSGEDGLGWGTRDIRSFTVEFDIAAGVVPSSLKVYAIQRAGHTQDGPVGLGLHRCVRRYVGNAGSTGRLEWTDLPLDPNARLLAAHFVDASIDSMEVKANNRVIFDADIPVMEDWLERHAVERVRQAGIFHVDFMENNRIGEGLPLAGLQDLRFRPNFTAAGAFTVIAETLETHVV